jgi:hypothetical protein
LRVRWNDPAHGGENQENPWHQRAHETFHVK